MSHKQQHIQQLKGVMNQSEGRWWYNPCAITLCTRHLLLYETLQ